MNASFVIDHLTGATNASYKTSLYKNNLCNVVLYLDNDEAGRKGIEDALRKGIIKETEYVISNCKGMKNSELEDLISFETYKDMIKLEYGINLNVSEFKSNGKQWSDRVRDVFQTNGKMWNSKIESDIKYKVAKIAITQKTDSLNPHKTNSIDALIRTLESFLQA